MLRKRKTERDVEYNAFIALIDVVFLLLLYFIMTFRAITEESLVNFSPAVSGKSVSTQAVSADFVMLEITDKADDGRCLLNGQAVATDKLPGWLSEIAANNPETGIVVFCHDTVKHYALVEILDICRKSPLKKISLVAK